MTSRLSRNIVWNLSGQAVLLVLGVLAVRFVFKRLGPDAFGIILFAQTASYMLVALCELGISSTTVREVAAHFKTDRPYISDLLRTGTLIYWGAYVLLALVVIASAPFLATHWINLKSIDAESATRLVRILGLGALLTLPRSLYASLFRGLQEMAVNNVIEVAALALQQLGIIAILAAGGGVLAVAGWFSASHLLSVLAYLTVSARFVPWRSLLPAYSAAVVRRNLTFSLHMMSNSVLGVVHSQTDKVLVSKLMPIGALGYYGFVATLVAGASRVTSSIVQAAFPSFSDLFHRLNRAGLLVQYQKVHGLVTFATAPLFAALTFAGLPVLSYVFNRSIALTLVVPLAILCFGSYLNAALSVPYTLSLAVGQPQIAARQNFLALFTVLPVAVLLVYRFGLVGAAGSWVFYHAFACSYGLPRIYRECLRIPLSSWYAHIIKVFALVTASYIPAFLVADLAGRSSVPALTIAYALASLAYLGGGYLMVGEDLRASVRRLTQWTRPAKAA